MLIDIFNKVLLLLLVLSGLNLIRHIFFIIQSVIVKSRYALNKVSLLLLGVSIAYIITSAISGFTLV